VDLSYHQYPFRFLFRGLLSSGPGACLQAEMISFASFETLASAVQCRSRSRSDQTETTGEKDKAEGLIRSAVLRPP